MIFRFLFIIIFILSIASGCGTTKWSDTSRTATEQLLISYAIDHTVEQLNFIALSGKKVFIATEAISATTDYKYISTTIRQHIASSGGLICDKADDAEYIVELRAGAVGTDRNDLMLGIPAITIPVATTNGTLPQIPEIPFIKRTDQRAVAKIAVFVYNKETGRPLWCSGNRQSEGNAKAWWVFGAGPINRGSIYNGTEFAGGQLPAVIPGSGDPNAPPPPLTTERFFIESKNSEKIMKAKEVAADTKPAADPPAPATKQAPTPTPATPPSPYPVPTPPAKVAHYGGINIQ